MLIEIVMAALMSAAVPEDNQPPAMEVTVSGEGAPVLLIPGLASGADVWAETADRLDDQYEVHIVHFAGFAGLPPVEGPFLETRLAALTNYLAAEELDGVTVIGHSLGGFMATELALTAPARVEKVVSVDSLPFAGLLFLGAPTEEAARPAAAQFAEQLLAMDDATYAAQAKMTAASYTMKESRQAQIVSSTLASDRATVAAAMQVLMTTDLRDDLPRLDAELLIIYPWAEGGPYTADQTDAFYRAQFSGAPRLSAQRIDNARHFVMYDQPEAFFKALESFLAP
ncbi:alpha/beta hydrolase [Parvularcula sp. LCG005]|uniref:alpha/beta fold hydrolase n=1 Tax=Parvularcula sp. LCG005 TaxID=3078805 RepID=UPI0029436568|nr:alpha/beta hydrolase [Parvularcula sp. LCG005]WOI53711.1 alpha/beta hydrolase [Parvularcula sp. LCG005]